MTRRRSARGAASAREPFAMARLSGNGSRAPSVATLLLALLLPGVASAGWGNENWGEMVWGAGAPQIPSMPIEGLIAVAVLLLGLSYWLLATRRRRAKRPPLHS